MTDEGKLDQAAQHMADARVQCTKLGVAPVDIAKIMLDEAVLGLAASGHQLSDIQSVFEKYAKRDLLRFYNGLVAAASGRSPTQSH